MYEGEDDGNGNEGQRKALGYYRSCQVRTTSMNFNSVLDMVRESGGWSFSNLYRKKIEVIKKGFEEQLMVLNNKYGADVLFRFVIQSHPEDPKRNFIEVSLQSSQNTNINVKSSI